MGEHEDQHAYAKHIIAAVLDRPSIYMGGPSQPSLRRAEEILDQLLHNGFIVIGGRKDGQ